MITDFDDFATWMFVIIDDLWLGIASLYRRPGPDPSSCSDSELITVALLSECRTWDRETQAMQEWAAYRHLFPRLPERSRFNRRRRNLMGAIKTIRQIVLSLLDVAQEAYGAIDSLPLQWWRSIWPRNGRATGMPQVPHLAIARRRSKPFSAIACIWL